MGASSKAPPANALVVIRRPHGERAAIGVVDVSDLAPVWGQPRTARVLVSARGAMEDLGLLYHDTVQYDRARVKALGQFREYNVRWEDMAVISAPGAPAIGGLVRRRDVSRDWVGVVTDVDTTHRTVKVWNVETAVQILYWHQVTMVASIVPLHELPLKAEQAMAAVAMYNTVRAPASAESPHRTAVAFAAGLSAAAADAGARAQRGGADSGTSSAVGAEDVDADAGFPGDDEMHAELVDEEIVAAPPAASADSSSIAGADLTAGSTDAVAASALTRARTERALNMTMRRMFGDGNDTAVVLFLDTGLHFEPRLFSPPASARARVFAVDRTWDAAQAMVHSRERVHLYGGAGADSFFTSSASLSWSRAIVIGAKDHPVESLLRRASARAIITFIDDGRDGRGRSPPGMCWHLKEEHRSVVTSDGCEVRVSTYVNCLPLLVGWDMEDLDAAVPAAAATAAAATAAGPPRAGAGAGTVRPASPTVAGRHEATDEDMPPHTYCT